MGQRPMSRWRLKHESSHESDLVHRTVHCAQRAGGCNQDPGRTTRWQMVAGARRQTLLHQRRRRRRAETAAGGTGRQFVSHLERRQPRPATRRSPEARAVRLRRHLARAERSGFNYNDDAKVAAQFESAKAAILKYKDHPAVLLWGIGNEMEGYQNGDNPKIWKAVNDIAAMAKQVDPNHPTMTVIAEIGGARVKCIHQYCLSIDIVGINSYGGCALIAKRYVDAGGIKPYVITEFGTAGTWEIPKTSYGAVQEPTSTQKAEMYRKNYEGGIAAHPELCLGSYAFTWGWKQEGTLTWFGMLISDGGKTEACETMSELWTGKPVANHADDRAAEAGGRRQGRAGRDDHRQSKDRRPRRRSDQSHLAAHQRIRLRQRRRPREADQAISRSDPQIRQRTCGSKAADRAWNLSALRVFARRSQSLLGCEYSDPRKSRRTRRCGRAG